MAQAQKGERFRPAFPAHHKLIRIAELGITPRTAKMRAKRLAETFGTRALTEIITAKKCGGQSEEIAVYYVKLAAYAAHAAGIGTE